jgi:hypothetical protein
VLSRAVTEDDVARGQVRFPPEARRVLPAERARVTVELCGRRLFDVRWDPMDYPDQDRSPSLRPGAEAMGELVRPGTELRLSVLQDGSVVLG